MWLFLTHTPGHVTKRMRATFLAVFNKDKNLIFGTQLDLLKTEQKKTKFPPKRGVAEVM